nr:MAG TPA: hypothetical protein [Caudoviricetes sp.]
MEIFFFKKSHNFNNEMVHFLCNLVMIVLFCTQNI